MRTVDDFKVGYVLVFEKVQSIMTSGGASIFTKVVGPFNTVWEATAWHRARYPDDDTAPLVSIDVITINS